MLDISHRHRVVVSFVALLVALAGASCSSDTRAILAPSDSQLSLTASGPVIANQAIEITVVASKSDGGPVADGTEIQLSASSGSFEPSKVRTQGGQAVASYSAGGPGSIELVAASDTVQGKLAVVAASARPTQISITASADSVPSGGGELDVTATVVGPSGEAVASAPVEFFATNGAFAPVGPLLTNADGKVTARLSTPDATEVRARVLGVESSTLSIAVQQPLGKGDDPSLPFRMSELVWLHAPDAADWDVTSTIFEVTFDPQGTSNVTKICFPHSKAGKWKVSGAGEGNVWVIAEVDGTWYAATWDYIRPGQICKSANGFTWNSRRDGIFAHTQRAPLEGRVPRSGDRIGIMVSGFARTSQRTVLEKSNIFMTVWP
jgi:hypothetical protein